MSFLKHPMACIAAVTGLLGLAISPLAAQSAAASSSLVAGADALLDAPGTSAATEASGQISGTIMDTADNVISGVTVVLDGPGVHQSTVTNDNGMFLFKALNPGNEYHVHVKAEGHSNWDSEALTVSNGDLLFLPAIRLALIADSTSVTVYADPEQLATEEVRVELQQRVLGIIPNFYVAYSSDATPLNAKLKFKMAMRVAADPVTIAAVAMMAGVYQASDTPNYVQGAKGYGQRFGSQAANDFSAILIGAAVLPSLLHQDPRYFYQGTGTTSSRMRHAIFSPFICRSDSGHWQPNYSSMGGDLASDSLANLYYPSSNRGVGLVFDNFAIGTAERMATALAQEFILSHFTSRGK